MNMVDSLIYIDMRAIWSGSLSFGLINIPVRIYSASEERGLNLDLLEKKTLKPIGYARVIRGTDKMVAYEDIVRGYEYKKGDYVVLLDDELKRAHPKKTKSIEIVNFTDEDDIDPIYYQKPYYIEPDKKATKAYVLLREALKRTKKVAVAKFIMREKEYIGAIKPEGNVLVLTQMRYDEDIRDTKGLDIPIKEDYEYKELQMAVQLINQLTEPFDPEEFKDTYTDEVMDIIKAKAKGKKVKPVEEEPDTTEDVDDLLAILKESLEGKSFKKKLAKVKK